MNRLLNIILCGSLALFCSLTYAAESASQIQTATKSLPPSKAKNDLEGYKGKSERAREGKNFVAHGEIGLVNILEFGVGANFGAYLDRNSLLELDLFRSSFGIFGFESTTTTWIGRHKLFTGNSFFIQYGGGVRRDEAVDDNTWTTREDDIVRFSSNSIVASFDIGNRWQMDSGFSIGCDWVGATLPLVTLSSSESYGKDVSESEKGTRKSEFERQSERVAINTVRFHIGASF